MTRVAIKGLLARPLRTILTSMAIVLGVALVTAAFVITDTQGKGADALSGAAYDGTAAVVSAKTTFELDTDSWGQRPVVDAAVLDQVRSVPGVTHAVGDVTDFNTRIIGSDDKPVGQGPWFGVGLDSQAAGVGQLTPFRLDEGEWATGPGQVVIDAKTAEDEGYAVGDTVPLTTRGGLSEFELTGVATFGPVESLGSSTVAIFDLGVAQELFNKQGSYDSILVGGDDAAATRAALTSALGSEVTVQSAVDHDRFTLTGLEQFIDILQVILLVFGIIAVVVGAFTIVNTLSITIAQRAREFGLLRMVGASRGQVLRSVLVEALAIGAAASVVGVAVGYGLAKLLGGMFAALGLDLPSVGTVFETRTIIVALLVGILSTLFAGIWPARRATRIAPVEALRDAAGAGKAPGLVARAFRGAVSVLGRPSERLGGIAGRLARRNAMRSPGRIGATASALIIGVALVTLLAVVAAGLKDSVSTQLEQRVAATHVVVGEDGWSPIDQQIERALAAAPGVTAISSIRQDAGLLFGEEEGVNGVDPASIGKVFDFDWAQGDRSVLAGLGTDGAVVDKGWAEEHGLKVGSEFSVTSVTGKKLDLVVRGVEQSPVIDSLGFGPVTISREVFDDAFATDLNRMTLVSATDTGALREGLAKFPEAQVQPKGEYIDDQLAAIDPLLAILGVLLALCVMVSLFGIVNALVLATFERTREIGTLRALGMTRRQLRRMVRHESIITALLGAAMGIVVGLAGAWLLTNAFEEEGLQFVLPVGSLIAFAIVAVLAGIAAAALPARRAARLDPLNALAYE